jgi:hypothetical protein
MMPAASAFKRFKMAPDAHGVQEVVVSMLIRLWLYETWLAIGPRTF